MGFCTWSWCLFHLFFAEIDRLQMFKNILDIEHSLVTAWSAFIFSVKNLGFPLDFPADIFWGQWLRVKAVGGLLWSDAASLIGPAAHSIGQLHIAAHSTTERHTAPQSNTPDTRMCTGHKGYIKTQQATQCTPRHTAHHGGSAYSNTQCTLDQRTARLGLVCTEH